MEIIPVIKAHMGGRDYYLGKMSMQDIAAKIQFYSDLRESKELETMLQRELKKRSLEMTEYLLKQPERFYGAIIIASWGGKPSYKEIQMEDHPILSGTEFKYGVLVFDGKQEYFALDGQHRLKSIKEAINTDQSLRSEEVAVIIIPHEQTEEGNVKTRRLFHTLNRYAKPTTTGENISLDEDNVISIVTRMLVRNVPLLRPDLLELEKGNIAKSQSKQFTTLAAVYDFNQFIFNSLYQVGKDYLKFRPAADHVENSYSILHFAWTFLVKQVDELQQVSEGLTSAGEFRLPDDEAENGNILFRPIGIQIYGQLIAQLISRNVEEKQTPGKIISNQILEKAIKTVLKLPRKLNQLPWKGAVFRNNKIERGGKSLSFKLADYMLGSEAVSEEDLLTEYRGHLEDNRAQLPSVIK